MAKKPAVMSFVSKDQMPQQPQTTADGGVKREPPIVIVKDLQTFRPEDSKRSKSVGSSVFFACADSAAWILCIMCRRQPPSRI
jgi:hypothetical protein